MRFGALPFVAASLLAGFALWCSSGSSSPYSTLESKLSRDEAPVVSDADEASLVTGNTSFACSLYQQLTAAGVTGNFAYSPYSISLALAMTYAGAAGATATQMAAALDFTLPPSSLHPAFDKLDLAIETKPKDAAGTTGQPFALDLVDSLWGDTSLTFQQAFLDTLAQDYGSGVHTADFANNPTAGEAAVNDWVATETNNRIDPLLPPNTIDESTRIVIVNAVYFDAAWETPFDPGLTEPRTFTLASGHKTQVPMMASQSAVSAYAKGTNWQAVESPTRAKPPRWSSCCRTPAPSLTSRKGSRAPSTRA